MNETFVPIGVKPTVKRSCFVALAFAADLAEHYAVGLAANGCGDLARNLRYTLYPSQIFLFNAPLLHSAGKQGGGMGMTGNRYGTSRLAVETVYGTEHKGHFSVMVAKGIG